MRRYFDFDSNTTINEKIDIVISDDHAFVLNLDALFQFRGCAASTQLYLQSPLINPSEKPIAKLSVDLEGSADDFACGLFVQKLGLDLWLNISSG